MKKTIFGIATVLALTTTSAFAGNEKPIEKSSGDARISKDGPSRSKGVTAIASGRGEVRVARADAGTTGSSSSSSDMRAVDVNASHAERWLVERDGYRDGGY